MVTLITINYNSTELLKKLILSVFIHLNNLVSEIIIVDNNSKDFNSFNPNLPKGPNRNIKIITLKNKKNLGFAKAVNQAINKSSNNYLLLINPDCTFVDDSFKHSLYLMQSNSRIGVVGGRLISNNNIQYSATNTPNFFTSIFEFSILKKLFKNNYFSKQFWIESNRAVSEPISCHSVCGAYMLIRKIIPKLLFDEKYFLYLEDLDFGTVTKNAGYLTFFNPLASVTHVGGASSNNKKYNIVHKYWYDSRDYYFSKHFKGILRYITIFVYFIEKQLLINLKIGDLHNTVNKK